MHFNKQNWAAALVLGAASVALVAGPALAGGAMGAPGAIAAPPGGAGGAGAGDVLTPGNGAQIVPALKGRVVSIDKEHKNLVLDNGITYAIATNVDLGNITQGQTVELTLTAAADAAKDGPMVVKITPVNGAQPVEPAPIVR